MNLERFSNDFSDSHSWIKGSKGVLKDHLDVTAKINELA
jgi:hypothetical protein